MAKAQEQDQEKEQIAQCQRVLAVFARISPRGEMRANTQKEDGPVTPQFSGAYVVTRCHRTCTITAGDIKAAADCLTKPVTLADCQKALRPFAKLPVDLRVEDPAAPIYIFGGSDDEPVEITNTVIEQAQMLLG
jgi:hypothetical protein